MWGSKKAKHVTHLDATLISMVKTLTPICKWCTTWRDVPSGFTLHIWSMAAKKRKSLEGSNTMLKATLSDTIVFTDLIGCSDDQSGSTVRLKPLTVCHIQLAEVMWNKMGKKIIIWMLKYLILGDFEVLKTANFASKCHEKNFCRNFCFQTRKLKNYFQHGRNMVLFKKNQKLKQSTTF